MKKNIFSIIIVMCIVFTSTCSVFAEQIQTDESYGFNMKTNLTFCYYGESSSSSMEEFTNIQWIQNPMKFFYAKDVQVTSSDDQVASAQIISPNNEGFHIKLTLKSPGTTVLKLTGTVDGKKLTRKSRISVLEYQNPLSVFKINGKDYSKKFKKTTGIYNVQMSPQKVKVKCQSASGWKVKEIYATREIVKGEFTTAQLEVIKSNSTEITLDKNQEVTICVESWNDQLQVSRNQCIKLSAK